MKKLTLVICLFVLNSFASVREIDQFVQASAQIGEGTVVVTDLDNTLIEPKQTIGSAQWYDYLVGNKMREGRTPAQAVNEALSLWVRVQLRTDVLPVEPAIPSFIRGWQDSGAFVIGLTARPTSLVDTTERQLESVGIDLKRHSLFEREVRLPFKRNDALYANGVIYAGPELNKGGVLAAFFERIGIRPKKVVFIDDMMKNVKNVERAAKKAGFTFAGLRYGGADARVKTFDAVLADKQLQYFEGILTDDQTRKLAE